MKSLDVLKGMLVFWLVAGCQAPSASTGAQPVSSGEGRRLAKGPCAELRMSPDDHFVAFLVNPEKPRAEGLPPQMVLGELAVAELPGGGVRTLGTAVTNFPGGFAFSPDSRWLFFLEGYNAVSQEGKLFVLDLKAPKASPVPLGRAVTYVVFSADSHWLGWVDNGTLKVRKLGENASTEVAGEVSTAAFFPDGSHLLFKRKLSAGGGLNVVPTGRWTQIQKLSDDAGDYAVSPDSKTIAFGQRSQSPGAPYELYVARGAPLKTAHVASGLGRFSFSGDSKWLSWTEVKRPDEPGRLEVAKAPFTSSPLTLGEKVQEFAFAPDSSAMAYLDSYHAPTRAGVMTVASLPDGKPKRVGYRTPFFAWGNKGRFLAFSAGVLKPIYSIDLMLYGPGDAPATKVLPWVFGYGFAPDDSYLLARSNCIRNGRACDLYSLDLSKPKEAPEKILDSIYSFKTSQDGSKLLVSYARTDGELFDIAAYDRKGRTRKILDSKVQLPVFFAAKDGSQVIYLVGDPTRSGVYLTAVK